MRIPDHEVTPPRRDHQRDSERTLPRSCGEVLEGVARALRTGIERLSDGERALAKETEHLDDLQRRLVEARDALHGPLEQREPTEPPDAARGIALDIARAAAAPSPDGEQLRAVLDRLAPSAGSPNVILAFAATPGSAAEIEGTFLWPTFARRGVNAKPLSSLPAARWPNPGPMTSRQLSPCESRAKSTCRSRDSSATRTLGSLPARMLTRPRA
jgi:hypothetical protein